MADPQLGTSLDRMPDTAPLEVEMQPTTSVKTERLSTPLNLAAVGFFYFFRVTLYWNNQRIFTSISLISPQMWAQVGFGQVGVLVYFSQYGLPLSWILNEFIIEALATTCVKVNYIFLDVSNYECI